jgi:hypothetical protein
MATRPYKAFRFIWGSVSLLHSTYREHCSLKTEEKTERQCGQRGDLGRRRCLSIQGWIPIHPKTKTKIKLGTGALGLFPPSPTDFPERHLHL